MLAEIDVISDSLRMLGINPDDPGSEARITPEVGGGAASA
jgi:hypothetical protein